MGSLRFFYGTMNCGKSTLALQIDHNNAGAGKRGLRLTMHDREGAAISSRIGLSREAIVLDAHTDIERLVRGRLGAGEALDYLICDEAQFYTPAQVEQLALIADELDIDVDAFGLLSDFATQLFPGSKRLMELADERTELQVRARCWCGAPATHNARTIDGRITYEGEQIVVGDIDGGRVAYEVLCRRHYRQGVTGATADAVGDPEPMRSDR